MINWQDHITSDDNILLRKPFLKITRISVEFILERLADGCSEKEILENYPRLTSESIKAVFSYACDWMKDGFLYRARK